MEKKQSPFAIVQIGVGIACLLIGVSGFLLSVDYILALEGLFLGAAVLLYGLINNTVKAEKGKILSYIASGCMIIAFILIFYNSFFNTK